MAKQSVRCAECDQVGGYRGLNGRNLATNRAGKCDQAGGSANEVSGEMGQNGLVDVRAVLSRPVSGADAFCSLCSSDRLYRVQRPCQMRLNGRLEILVWRRRGCE